MYEYRARIVRVIDGDTVEAELDLGFRVSLRAVLRLVGINAPEVHGPDRPRGLAATKHLRELLLQHTPADDVVTVRTQKDVTEKYGRYLAVILAGAVNVNDRMIADGHAVPYLV
jgi:micrococcal nuclease